MYKVVDPVTHIITGIYDGKKMHDNCIDLPEYAQERTGEDDRMYSNNMRRPLQELLVEGIIEIPIGYKAEANQFVPLDALERVLAGLDDPPVGKKLLGDTFIDQTLDEQLAAGIITEAVYRSQWNVALEQQCDALERKTVRAMRAMMLKTDTLDDRERVLSCEEQILELRKQFK